MAIWCIGFFAIGFVVVGVEVAGGEEGVIGAVWAQLGAAIARAATMATPVKRCFMLFVLCGNSGFGTTRQRRALSPAEPLALGWKQPIRCFVPADTQLSELRVGTQRAPDDMSQEVYLSSTWSAADVRN